MLIENIDIYIFKEILFFDKIIKKEEKIELLVKKTI